MFRQGELLLKVAEGADGRGGAFRWTPNGAGVASPGRKRVRGPARAAVAHCYYSTDGDCSPPTLLWFEFPRPRETARGRSAVRDQERTRHTKRFENKSAAKKKTCSATGVLYKHQGPRRPRAIRKSVWRHWRRRCRRSTAASNVVAGLSWRLRAHSNNLTVPTTTHRTKVTTQPTNQPTTQIHTHTARPTV